MKIIGINVKKPKSGAIREAARVIRAGGVVIFPTETVYGLGVNVFDRGAVKKIFRIKGRPEHKPISILIAKKKDLTLVVKKIPPLAKKLITKFWPGPLTLILEKKAIVPVEISGTGPTVAVRLSSHSVARALITAAGMPITATSANLSGKPPHRTVNTLLSELGSEAEIDIILDAGPTPIGQPSTILDLTKNPPVILREGSITKERIDAVIESVSKPKEILADFSR